MPSAPPPPGDGRAGTTARLSGIAGLAFDLDGTIYLGPRLLPGALSLIEALAAAGVPYLFATNNSSKTGAAYVRHLTALGLPADRGRVLTSNDVAIHHLRRVGLRRPYLVATPEVEDEYSEQGIEHADDAPDAVLLTFDLTLTYEKLRRASDLVRSGLPYLATHPDLVCPTPSGPIPDCGSFIELLAAATGERPLVLGKPQASMASAICDRLGLAPQAVAFVGDRLYTDVRMALDHGFVAVLTLTGEAQLEHVAASPSQPHVIVETMQDLHAQLRRAGVLA
jgi:4-nitrophenyl phosphatase